MLFSSVLLNEDTIIAKKKLLNDYSYYSESILLMDLICNSITKCELPAIKFFSYYFGQKIMALQKYSFC